MPNKTITVQLEVEWDDEETLEVYSVLPVSVDTHNLSADELRAVYLHFRHADDAEFDLMWDLKHHVSEALSEMTG